MSKKPDIKTSKGTQESLLISEIKDGVVVMHDGSLRAVVLASAINFDLMSQAEQNAAEYSFQGFLNSLHFPVQIYIRSQRIDLDSYLEKLIHLRQGMDNDLLGSLMEDYIDNIHGLVDQVNIMAKQFYVIVPFFPSVVTKAGFVSNLKTIFSPTAQITVTTTQFDQYKTELNQRVQLIAGGLNQIGVRSIPLNTQELVELYYNVYNPDTATNQKLIDAAELQTATVTGGPIPVVNPQASGQKAEVIKQAPEPVIPMVVPTPPAPVAPHTMVMPTPPPAPEPQLTPAPPPPAAPVAPPKLVNPQPQPATASHPIIAPTHPTPTVHVPTVPPTPITQTPATPPTQPPGETNV